MAAIHFDEQKFQEVVVEGKETAIIDFWAPWCGPCQAMGPVIDNLAVELEGKVLVGKIDIDQYKKLAMKYRVMSIPTILLFKDGVEAQRLVGVNDIEKLRAMAE